MENAEFSIQVAQAKANLAASSLAQTQAGLLNVTKKI